MMCYTGETLLSPLVMCGPHGLVFRKPVELRLPHSASVNPDTWSFALKSSDSPSGTQTERKVVGGEREREKERERERERARERGRQAGRQADRQLDRQTDIQSDRQTERQTERERERKGGGGSVCVSGYHYFFIFGSF